MRLAKASETQRALDVANGQPQFQIALPLGKFPP